MGQSESRTIIQGEPPPELSQQHILRRNDNFERPPFAPQFAPYTPKTLYKIKCPFSINLKSIFLHPINPQQNDQFSISFSGKCSQPFTVEIFTFAKETANDDLLTTNIQLLPTSQNQNRITPAPCLINENGDYSFDGYNHDMGIVKIEEIQNQNINMKDTWSAIIRFHIVNNDPSIVHTLLVYCIMKVVNGNSKIVAVAQKCLIQDHGFYLSEMYGLGDLSKAEGESRECVICMTNERNTCVLPCRHICCCAECANTLRLQTDRCPVCREVMTELVYLTVNPDYLDIQKDNQGNQNIEMQPM